MLIVGSVEDTASSISFIYGGLAQLARAPALHAGGHRFDSDILHNQNNNTKDYLELFLKGKTVSVRVRYYPLRWKM